MRITGPVDVRFMAVQRLGSMLLSRSTAGAVEAVLPQAAPMPLAQPQTSVAMLLAIAASDPESRRRRNVVEAARGLGALERMDAAQRIGQPSATHLRELAAWMNSHALPDDPDAAGLLRDVELRVLVELAKAEQG